MRTWLCIAAIVLSACSRSSARPEGRIVVAITIDWEGAYFSGDALDALDQLRDRLGAVPFTHFASAAYFSKPTVDPQAVAHLAAAVREGDELAIHLHAWRSLAQAAGLEPKLSPSFLSGTQELLEFPDGDVGFDTDLDVYGVADLRALVRTSRRLLERTHIPISSTFRAGGYLATPKVLQAIRDEGLTVDSSATSHLQFNEPKDKILRERIAEVWPNITSTSQPFMVETPGGSVIEMPIAAIADYGSTAELVGVVESAQAALRSAPARSVFVVLAFHQETADEFGARLVEAIETLRARHDLAPDLVFTTLEKAAGATGLTSHP